MKDDTRTLLHELSISDMKLQSNKHDSSNLRKDVSKIHLPAIPRKIQTRRCMLSLGSKSSNLGSHRSGREHVTPLLLSSVIPTHKPSIWFIIKKSRVTELEIMLRDTSLDLNQILPSGDSLLHLSLNRMSWNADDIQVLTMLLSDSRIQVNVINTSKNAPIHLFCEHFSDMERCELILELFVFHSVKFDVVNAFGETCLHKAMFNQSLKLTIAKWLLTKTKIDPNAKSINDETALHYAVQLGRKDIIKLLVLYNADFHIANKYGNTPYHCAVLSKKDHIAWVLESVEQLRIWLSSNEHPEFLYPFLENNIYPTYILINFDKDTLRKLLAQATLSEADIDLVCQKLKTTFKDQQVPLSLADLKHIETITESIREQEKQLLMRQSLSKAVRKRLDSYKQGKNIFEQLGKDCAVTTSAFGPAGNRNRSSSCNVSPYSQVSNIPNDSIRNFHPRNFRVSLSDSQQIDHSSKSVWIYAKKLDQKSELSPKFSNIDDIPSLETVSKVEITSHQTASLDANAKLENSFISSVVSSRMSPPINCFLEEITDETTLSNKRDDAIQSKSEASSTTSIQRQANHGGKPFPALSRVLRRRSTNFNLLPGVAFASEFEWEIDPDELHCVYSLGQGQSGNVFYGTYRNEGVAIKKLKTTNSDTEFNEFIKEFNILASFDSPYIIRFLGACLTDGLSMVMEYCPCGSLYDVMKRNQQAFQKLVHEKQADVVAQSSPSQPSSSSSPPFNISSSILSPRLTQTYPASPRIQNIEPDVPILNWAHFFSFATDIIAGLTILHCATPTILHRDIKSLNILVDKEFHAKLCDFGLSRLNTGSNCATLGKMRGTYAYIAPELYRCKTFSTKADVYSVSIVLWELIYSTMTGCYQRPYEEYNYPHEFTILIQVSQFHCRPNFPSGTPSSLQNLIRRGWSENVDERPEARDMLKEIKDIKEEFRANQKEWNECCQLDIHKGKLRAASAEKA